MTGTTDDNGDMPQPIDADFEPANSQADFVSPGEEQGRGPGWIALGITGAAAALFGGLLAGSLNLGANGDFAPQALAVEVESLSANQQAVEATIEALRTELTSAREQMSREIDAAAAGAGDDEALADLTTEIETLNGRLDALQTGEDDREGLDALVSRIDTLERADEEEVTSPRLANRAITALRARVEEIEEAQSQITNRQAIRAEALADLLSRVETIEENTAADSTADVAALRVELEALRAAIESDTGRTEDIEKLQQTVTALSQQGEANGEDALASKALFALLTMEAAAGDGRPFQSAHSQLLAALPDNATVQELGALANQSVPTIAMLQARFSDTEQLAIEAVEASEPSADGWGWLRSVFGDDLEIRRSGSGNSVEEVIQSAETALNNQDLREAVSALETLEEPASEAFATWLTDANRRLTLDESLDTLRLVLLGAER